MRNEGLILLIIVIPLLIGALPTWPYSSGWGYYLSGGLGLMLLMLILLLLLGGLGRIPPASEHGLARS